MAAKKDNGAFPWRLLDAADFTLDGGAMNGVVDRMIWEAKQGWKANANHMVPLKNNLPLSRAGGRVILVDAGVGACWPEKRRRIHDMQDRLEESLGAAGVDRREVTDVVFTHLHWDHAGGVVRPRAGGDPENAEETFPNATYYVNERQWKNALNPHPAEAGSYREPLEIRVLREAHRNRRVRLVRDGDALLEKAGLRLEVLDTGDGHTVGHQMVLFRRGRTETLAYFGDLVPTAYHLRLVHGMGYDLDRRLLADSKERLLDRAASEGWICYFDHEPALERQGVRLRRGDRPGYYEIISAG